MSNRLGRYYPTDHRITHIKKHSTPREKVVEAFSSAWRDGKEFHLRLKEDGSITIKQGQKEIASYRDAHAFAKDFMPELIV